VKTYAEIGRERLARNMGGQVDRRVKWFRRKWWDMKSDIGEMLVVVLSMGIFVCLCALAWAAVAGVEAWFR
jgi:hypothetical protein